MSRFDYVKYDEIAMKHQEHFKAAVTQVEQLLGILPDGRAKSLAMTSLEEVYMWIGKAIRDDQIGRAPQPTTAGSVHEPKGAFRGGRHG